MVKPRFHISLCDDHGCRGHNDATIIFTDYLRHGVGCFQGDSTLLTAVRLTMQPYLLRKPVLVLNGSHGSSSLGFLLNTVTLELCNTARTRG